MDNHASTALPPPTIECFRTKSVSCKCHFSSFHARFPSSVHVEMLVEEMWLERVYLKVLWLCPAKSFHQCSLILLMHLPPSLHKLSILIASWNTKIRQFKYKRNIEARSHNHTCREIAINITYSQCVYVTFVVKHEMRRRHIILLSVASLAVTHFSTLSHKR
jgi:hypothetical protein